MNRDELYFTSDQALAAFLCMRGYTLLGAVDTGSERLDYALTHADYYREPEKMRQDIQRMTLEFTMPFIFPNDTSGRKIDFKNYYMKLRMCKRALQYPISKVEAQQGVRYI